MKKLRIEKEFRKRNKEILEKIIASILESVFIIIIFQQNFLGKIIAGILVISNSIILLYDKDTLMISIIKILLNIR